MKNRVIVCALASFVFSLSLSAQRMAFGPPSQQSSPFPQSNSARSESSSISGTVQDTNNRPMSDVRVELRNNGSGVINSVFTNAAGAFEFPLVSSGTYLVVATTGTLQASERVDASGWSNVVILRMPTGNPSDGIGNSISVAQYKVPAKARDEYRKAEELFAKVKPEEANRHLAKALALCPNFAEALTLRGVLKLNQKDVDGAVTDLDQAVQADANYAVAYMVLGAAFNYQAKFDEALRALDRSGTLAPNSWQTHFEMGKAYVGKKDYPQALHQFELAQGLTPREYPVIQLFRANLLFAMKEYSKAAEAAQAYLLKEPQGPNSEQARKMLTQAQDSMARK